MKTFIYVVKKQRNDVNGNPRNELSIYRMRNNVPCMIMRNVKIGYMTEMQVVIEALAFLNEIPKKHHGKSWQQLRGENIARIQEVSV